MPANRSAQGKAAQRKRNKAAGSVSRSGSSGVLAEIRATPRVSYDEALGLGLEYLNDVIVSVQQVQLTADGGALVTMVVPPEWVQEAVDLHRASRSGLVFMRAHVLPSLTSSDGDGSAAG
jgi:hypothetical protein